MTKRILMPILALVLVLGSALATSNTHAASGPKVTVVINGQTFTRGANAPACAGAATLIPIYGSSAIKNLIVNTAPTYCTNSGGTVDVEYLSGGDSCPGAKWVQGTTAANANGQNNMLGASDVFAASCATEGIPVPNAGLVDNQINVNLVEAIAQCNGATSPQGGSWNGGAATPCLGGNPSQAGAGACTYAARTFPGPDSYSDQSAALLWSGSQTDYAGLGGCSGVVPGNLNRTSGSGTRVTYVFNLYGAFSDGAGSANVSSAADAPTTGDMVANVCGVASGDKLTVKSDMTNNSSASATVTGPTNGRIGLNSALAEGVIGYSSRSGVLAPYTNVTSGAIDLAQPIANCGIIALNGATGWNGACNPNYLADNKTPIGPGSVANPSGDTFGICPGDLQVSLGQYTSWGYIHLYSNSNFTNPAVTAYLNFLKQIDNASGGTTSLFNLGFMRQCQMNVSRSFDGGPYAANPATC